MERDDFVSENMPWSSASIAASHGVTGAAEIFGEIDFHARGSFEGHGIEVGEKFGEEADAVAFDDPGGFDAGFVIGETLFGCEAGHADVDAGKLGVALGIEAFDFAMARGG